MLRTMLPVRRLFALLLAVASFDAWADIYTVTRHDDPVPGACNVGDCSLREAVLAANAHCCAENTIILGTGSYGLPLGGLAFNGMLKIVGDSAATTTIEGDGTETVLAAAAGASIRLLDLAIKAHGAYALQSSVDGDTLLSRVLIPDPDSSIGVPGTNNGSGVFQVLDSEIHSYLDCGHIDFCRISGSNLLRLQVGSNDSAVTDVLITNSSFDQDLEPTAPTVVALQTLGNVDISHTTIHGTQGGLVITGAPPHIAIDHLDFSGNERPVHVAAASDVTISDSWFHDNDNPHALGNGGAALWLSNSGATATVTGSTFANNRGSDAYGGAVQVENGAALTLRNSTFSGNTFLDSAPGNPRGGAIGFHDDANITSLTLDHVTIVAPAIVAAEIVGTALGGYGGNTGLALVVLNSIVRGNCGLDAGAMDAALGNVESGGNTCNFGSGSLVSVSSTDLALGTLADHGGPTLTYKPGANSVAIDAADEAFCPDTDQRGYPRPFGGACDSGAVEADADVLFKDGFE